jgi:3-hydroxybutyryl-CoA dehydrogenase
MRLVEVIGGVLTEAHALDALTGVARRMGHHPVRATDTPGFLVNHAGRAFGTKRCASSRSVSRSSPTSTA